MARMLPAAGQCSIFPVIRMIDKGFRQTAA
jgi:hypothetical protein